MRHGSGENKLVLYAALASNVAIAIGKFVAAALTGSSAMLSEGVHSLVDSCDQLLLLYGQHRAKRPADQQHPLGYGREIYFWSFVVALLIFATGAGASVYEGVTHILNPEPIENVTISYAVLGFALMLEGASWALAYRRFRRLQGGFGWLEAIRRSKDPPSFIVFLEDSAAITGIVIAAAGVSLSYLTSDPTFDGIASILIGLLLASVAVLLAREAKHLLIGESAAPEIRTGLCDMASSRAWVRSVAEVLTIQMAPHSVFAALTLAVGRDRPQQLSCEIDKLEQEACGTWPEIRRLYVKIRDEAADC